MSEQLSLLEGIPIAGGVLAAAGRAVVPHIEAFLSEARRCGEKGPTLMLLAGSPGEAASAAGAKSRLSLATEARDLGLSRLGGANRGESTLRTYRNASDDLVGWAADRGRDEVLLTAAMVEHLDH